jgi:hypothetical protein
MADESMISIPQAEYNKLLKMKDALDAGECKTVARLHGVLDGPIKNGEFFIPNVESFSAGDRVVMVNVKTLP